MGAHRDRMGVERSVMVLTNPLRGHVCLAACCGTPQQRGSAVDQWEWEYTPCQPVTSHKTKKKASAGLSIQINIASQPIHPSAYMQWQTPASGPCFGTAVPTRAAPTAQPQKSSSPTVHRADKDILVKCSVVDAHWHGERCMM